MTEWTFFHLLVLQTLAIYDRFGRLMLGSEEQPKDVLEYLVIERHLVNPYSQWRLHGKIVPSWAPAKDPIIKVTLYSAMSFLYLLVRKSQRSTWKRSLEYVLVFHAFQYNSKISGIAFIVVQNNEGMQQSATLTCFSVLYRSFKYHKLIFPSWTWRLIPS